MRAAKICLRRFYFAARLQKRKGMEFICCYNAFRYFLLSKLLFRLPYTKSSEAKSAAQFIFLARRAGRAGVITSVRGTCAGWVGREQRMAVSGWVAIKCYLVRWPRRADPPVRGDCSAGRQGEISVRACSFAPPSIRTNANMESPCLKVRICLKKI